MSGISLPRIAAVVAVAAWSAPGVAQSSSFIDLTAGVGYSTNPFLSFSDDNDSAFGRLAARGHHGWRGERSATSLSAMVENTTYLNDHGSKQIFALNADTQHQASENVTVFGGVGFSGDIAGQLSNRFLFVPPEPEVPDPNLPPPPTVEDPDLFAFSGRQYRLDARGGAAIGVSERSSVTISGGGNRVWFADEFFDDYTTVFASGAYNTQFSERTTAGASVSVSRTEFENSDDSTTIVNPLATIRTQLSEDWDATASAGLTFADSRNDGQDDTSIDLSVNGTLCRTSQTERLCGRVSRYAQTSALANLVTTTSAGVDWYKKLDDAQTLQLSASVAQHSGEDITDDRFRTRHLRATASYSRLISDRFSVGTDLGFRSLNGTGPDPKADFSGSLFLRYRIGDLG